jgi:hypothetical protein
MKGGHVFIELMPLLAGCTMLITVAKVEVTSKMRSPRRIRS